MDYKIVVTKDAEEDLDRFIQYLIFEKKSTQAARNVLDDYDATIECLKHSQKISMRSSHYIYLISISAIQILSYQEGSVLFMVRDTG